MIVGLLAGAAFAQGPVEFADSNLKRAVEQTLSVVDPTPADMLNLTKLFAWSRGIRDLSGIESAANLAELDLANNQISELGPLAGLNALESLGLWNNRVSDLAPLQGLNGLVFLDLEGNQISDIAPLASLGSLKALWLSSNAVSDMSPLGGLNRLELLALDNNRISELSGLAGKSNLEGLDLSGNQISDIGQLLALTSLHDLLLGGNPLNTDAYCTHLDQIRQDYAFSSTRRLSYDPNPSSTAQVTASQGQHAGRVQVSWNPVCNGPAYTSHYRVYRRNSTTGKVVALSQWQTATTYDDTGVAPDTAYYYWVRTATDARGSYATTLSRPACGWIGAMNDPVFFADQSLKAAVEDALGIADPTVGDMLTLTQLTAEQANISDLTGLEAAINLSQLVLDKNRIRDLAPLSGLTNLSTVLLSENNIANLGPLLELVGIKELRLDDNVIEDPGPLAEFTELEHLSLSGNLIIDLGPLEELHGLTSLALQNNHIYDVLPLGGLSSLTGICLSGNKIQDISPLTELIHLEELDVSNNPLDSDAYCTYLHTIHAQNPWRPAPLTGGLDYSPNPNPPENVSASQGLSASRINITWDAVCNGPLHTSYYQVYRADAVDGVPVAISDWQLSTNLTDTDVQQRVVYYYSVKAAVSSMGTSSTDRGSYSTGWCGQVTTRTLSIGSAPGGQVVTPGEKVYVYANGTAVPVIAAPDDDYVFSHWTGTAVDAGRVADALSASTSVTVDRDYTLTAVFKPANPVKPAVSTYNARHITQTSAVLRACLVYDGRSPTECRFRYWTAGRGEHFTPWEPVEETRIFYSRLENLAPGTMYTFIGEARNAVGTKLGPPRSFETDVAGFLQINSTVGGFVKEPGEGDFIYDVGSIVSVRAVADRDYEFVEWSGAAVETGKLADALSPMTTVEVYDRDTLVANFAQAATTPRHSLALSATVGGRISAPGQGTLTYDHGQVVSVAATADAGYEFDGWTGTAVDAGKVAHPDSPVSSVVLDADYTLRGVFAVKRVSLPNVHTGEAQLMATSIVLSGSLLDTGGETCQCRFRYWSDDGYEEVTAWQSHATLGDFHAEIEGVVAGTEYYFIAEAKNSVGSVLGWAGSLTTGSTSTALEISSTAGGIVAEPGTGGFEYPNDAVVPIQALAHNNCIFSHWSGTAVDAGRVSDPYAPDTTVLVDDAYTLRAHFLSMLEILHVDDNGPADPGPGNPDLSDPEEDGTSAHPFDSVQEAIDVCNDGTEIFVLDGLYQEKITLKGRKITITGLWLVDPDVAQEPVIDAHGIGSVMEVLPGGNAEYVVRGLRMINGKATTGAAVKCVGASLSLSNCVISGNVATSDEGTVILCRDSRVVLDNCTVTGNRAGPSGAVLTYDNCNSPTIVNSIFWDNDPPTILTKSGADPEITYCDIEGGWFDIGNINQNPDFVNPGYWDLNDTPANADDDSWVDGDYHLKSACGRFWPEHGIWVMDTAITSPCIDAGNPNSDYTGEPSPNGGRINMGAYGRTDYASRSCPGQ